MPFSEYISVVPDYSPASPGKTYFSALNNSTDVILPTSSNFSLFHNDPYINVMNAYATFTPSPIPIPPPTIKSLSPEFFVSKELLSPKKQKQDQYFQDYEIGESSHDSTLEQHEKQIEEILNHLDELPLDRIERIEDDVEGLGVVGLIRWFKRIGSVFSRSNCAEENKVAFATGADRSFVSISFASMLNILSITLDTTYNIEMAVGNLISTNTIIQGCTPTLLNQPFEIDFMPIKLGSFDVVIGMDWLSKYHAKIIFDEKVIHIPIEDQTLIIRSNQSRTQLSLISCIKTKRYISKGCQVFITQVMEKKSAEKQLENILVVREFPDVFPEELSGLPTVRQVEFQIHLIPRAAPVARVPYRLAPSKMQELSNQLQELADRGFIRLNQEMAFQILKQKLCEASILALPEGNNDFVVYCDASIQGAVVFALKIWRHYLYDTKYIVFTDHKSLQHVLNQKELNMRQRRWLELLAYYDCEIRYHPGKENVIADALSQKRIIKSHRVKPLRVKSLIMNIHLNLPSQILEAQTEALKEENVQAENLQGMEKAFKIFQEN
nr:putative reverse transcriptase domain-containing protein [Tanacetum cinerariifolium]